MTAATYPMVAVAATIAKATAVSPTYQIRYSNIMNNGDIINNCMSEETCHVTPMHVSIEPVCMYLVLPR